MLKIHCLNNISAKGLELLSDKYELTDSLGKADGILVRSASLHDAEFSDNLLAIARAGAGVNNIPLDRCADEGIVVFNAPGANANAVKEVVLCSLFLGSRGIVDGINWVRDNADDPNIAKTIEKVKKQYVGREIIGKKLGVIGLGAIGALVANAAIDLGMEVYGYDPFVSVSAAWRVDSNVKPVTNLDDLCSVCDYITIHVPSSDSTKGMIGEHEIGLMKNDAVFLNFSRDTLVDIEALVSALDDNKLGCYLTDFATPALMKAQRGLIALPHLGASTVEAEENCAVMAVQELMDYIENGNITNSVNYPACDMGPVPEGNSRIAVLHSNVPNVISGLTNAIGAENINVEHITSKARGAHAYAMVDTDKSLDKDTLARIEAIEGVRRVRIIK